jgi:predicted ArsR family transcriptional regulator
VDTARRPKSREVLPTLSTDERIRELLGGSGALDAGQIANALGLGETGVRGSLKRLVGRGVVVRTTSGLLDTWELVRAA